MKTRINFRYAIQTAFTGSNDMSVDIIRVLTTLSFFVFFTLEVYKVMVMQKDFNPMEFAAACGTMFTTAGASLLIKSKTEPQ